MHKAQKEIKKLMPDVDIVLEVVDARLPEASHNTLLAEHIADKTLIKLLNKKDLADPVNMKNWIKHLTSDKQKALAINAQDRSCVLPILDFCRRLAPEDRGTTLKPIRLLVLGIPNVGKSTLINSLVGRKIASVGNEPAVTKRQQRIKLAEDIVLYDTPGVMLPRAKNEDSAFCLAISGAIRDTAMPYIDVAHYAVELFAKHYPEQLMQRYKLSKILSEPELMIEKIAKQRGCVKHGRIDLERVSKLIIHEYRSGKLGCLSLEFII
jgi:ribosome biogenesis GTPase A